jgi:cytochrome c553
LNEALRMTQAMPQSQERGEAVESITRALFLQGIDAAMAFPASVTEAHLRGGFVKEIAQRLAQKDAAKAAAWIAAMPDGDIQNRAARDVAGALARVDISDAASWVKTLKPEAQVEAARGVIHPMSSENIAATAQWVSTLAGTPNYDRAVEEFVWSCNSRAPEQSAAWIQGVADPLQQRKLYHRMLGEWAKRDAPAVKQWVSTNNVPADVFQRFSR